MRTILSGPVTREVMARAWIQQDIEPSLIICNGHSPLPADLDEQDIFVQVIESDPAWTDMKHSIRARDYAMCQQADALILVGDNDHLLDVARRFFKHIVIHHET